MRLINAEDYPCSKCENKYCFQSCNRFIKWLYDEAVVQCKSCKNSMPLNDPDYIWCNRWHEEVYRNGFCYEGVRGETT